MEVNVLKLVVGPLSTNCYVVYSPKLGEAIIIDPGGSLERILSSIERLGVNVAGILATHCHFDHIYAVNGLIKRWRVKFYVHRREVEILGYSRDAVALWLGDVRWEPPKPDVLIEEGELTIGGIRLTVIHTPGHTPGSVCVIVGNRIFTGDTLFRGGIGRTDFKGGDEDAMVNSLRRLSELPDNLIVHPGHGPDTTLGYEKASNPFMTVI